MKTPKKVSTVEMDQNGRIHVVDGAGFNIHALYSTSLGLDDNALLGAMEDEEAFDAGLKAFEEAWLRERGVTHVVDYEDFGDRKVHTLQEFLDC